MVVLDLQMPISNGYETCEKILQLYKPGELFSCRENELKPLMIACSGHIDQDVSKRASDVGFNLSMICPLKIDDI